MAIKRMFSAKVLETDNFIDLPTASQALYVHLCMIADDDGFIGNLKRVVNSLSISSEDDLKLLFLKGYLIMFPSRVVVIAHWRIHNTIRKDRYVPTIYQDELKLLKVNKVNKYFLDLNNQNGIPNVIPNGNQMGVTDIGIDIGIGIDIDKVCVEEKTHTYFDNEILNDTFSDFLSMRKTIGRPMMDTSIKLMIKKLSDLSQSDESKMIKILQQAILRGTPDIYPLDSDIKKQQAQNKFQNFTSRDNDYGDEIYENASDFEGQQ